MDDSEEAGRCVLIVEDDAALRELYAERVERIDSLDVRTAADGTAALEQLDDTIDLLLLDLELPVYSGFDLLEKVTARGLELPVVIITGREPSGEEDYPGDEYLVKPVSNDTLRKTIARYVDSVET